MRFPSACLMLMPEHALLSHVPLLRLLDIHRCPRIPISHPPSAPPPPARNNCPVYLYPPRVPSVRARAPSSSPPSSTPPDVTPPCSRTPTPDHIPAIIYIFHPLTNPNPSPLSLTQRDTEIYSLSSFSSARYITSSYVFTYRTCLSTHTVGRYIFLFLLCRFLRAGKISLILIMFYPVRTNMDGFFFFFFLDDVFFI